MAPSQAIQPTVPSGEKEIVGDEPNWLAAETACSWFGVIVAVRCQAMATSASVTTPW